MGQRHRGKSQDSRSLLWHLLAETGSWSHCHLKQLMYVPICLQIPDFTELTNIGIPAIDPGFKSVPVVYGPMGRGVEDLEAAARAVIGRRGSDKFYFPAPIPYRDVQLPKKLKFGYYLMDGLVKASPACKRAVLETVEALRREGHECVEFDVPWRKACIPEPNCLV
jgi:hypothetical protein